MARQPRPQPRKFDSQLVWAASAAAYRVQGNKYQSFENRALMETYLSNTSQITALDQELGQEMMQYFQGLMFRVLSGERVQGYLDSLMKLASEPEVAEYQLGIIASAAKSYEEMSRRDAQTTEEKILGVQTQPLGGLGEKLELMVRVIRTVYSEKYGVYFVTAVKADSSDLVFFSYKQMIDPNTQLKIRGTVKRHTDDFRTQLNRVKVLDTAPVSQ